jgi:hypothetical protein
MNVVSRPDSDHPWRAAFMADPDQELDRLLSGYARLKDLSGAAPADVARAVFGEPGIDQEGREALDRAALTWLQARRNEGRRPLPGWGRPRALRAIMDALDIIGAMQLPNAAIEINRHMTAWLRWTSQLTELGGGDVRAAFLTAVAITQRLVARQPGGKKSSLEAFWLSLAAQAGSAMPQPYLQQALLGLRRLPERDTPPERPWMTGLARWAETSRPTPREFASEWRGLRALYPHVPAYWRDLLEDTLDQHGVQNLPEEIRNVWKSDLGLTVSAGEQTARRRAKPVSPPPIGVVMDMQARVHLPLATSQADLQRIFAERERYAEATGEDYFLVTTVCNLGQLLLKKGPPEEESARGQLMEKAARMALKWQPTNVYAWSLWRDSISAQGYADDAEAIGWALISRFPEDPKSRRQLADILAQRSERRDLARILLTETLSRFPNENVAFTRCQLAELLIATNDLDGAGAVLAESDDVSDVVYATRAKIAFQTDRDESVRVLKEGIRRFPSSDPLKNYLEMIDRGQALYLLSDFYRQPQRENKGSLRSDDELLLAARQEGRTRRLQTEMKYFGSDEQWRTSAISTVESDLADHPDSETLKYLAERLNIQTDPAIADGRPTALSAAIAAVVSRSKSADTLFAASSGTQFERAIADVSLIYLNGDEAASERVASWLQDPTPAALRPISALRQFLMTRTGGKIDQESLKALAANDNLAIDIVEAALIPMQLALAA